MKKLSLFLSITMVVWLVSAVSCVNKEVPVAETYYETEYRTEYKAETYIATEDVVVKTIEGSELLSTVEPYWGGGYYGYNISICEYVNISPTEWAKEVYLKTGVYPTSGATPLKIVRRPLEYSRSRVQITFRLQQLNRGIIYVIDLTDACHDQHIRFPGLLFGKDLPPAGFGLLPREYAPEGCQVVAPAVARGADFYPSPDWLRDYDALIRIQERRLVTLLVGKETMENNSLSFCTKGIEEFAVIICDETVPMISPPVVKLIWSDDIIEKKEVIKERQVPYEVPVQVEKQRTVMQTKNVPFWEAIFH